MKLLMVMIMFIDGSIESETGKECYPQPLIGSVIDAYQEPGSEPLKSDSGTLFLGDREHLTGGLVAPPKLGNGNHGDGPRERGKEVSSVLGQYSTLQRRFWTQDVVM